MNPMIEKIIKSCGKIYNKMIIIIELCILMYKMIFYLMIHRKRCRYLIWENVYERYHVIFNVIIVIIKINLLNVDNFLAILPVLTLFD